MNNRLKPIGDKIRESGAILQAGVWLSALCVVAVFLTVRDYYTSMLGISGMPLAPAPPDVAGMEAFILNANDWVVAFLPQGVAWLGTFIFIVMKPESKQEERLRYGALAVAIVSHLVDIYTGYIYYIHPLAATITPATYATAGPEIRAMVHAALFHSAIADTVGSEILTSVCFGLLMILWPDLIKQLDIVLDRKKKPVAQPVTEPVAQPQRARQQQQPQRAQAQQRRGWPQ